VPLSRTRSHARAGDRGGRDRGRDRSHPLASFRTLRRRWQAVFGRKPPVALSKDLLGRMIAHHLQEQTFGGLDRDSLTFLDSLARQGGPPRRQFRRMSANFGGTGSGPAGVDPRVAAVDPAQLLEPLQERPGSVRPAGQLNNLMGTSKNSCFSRPVRI
jgi:Protein of unknown function (DUF2924)